MLKTHMRRSQAKQILQIALVGINGWEGRKVPWHFPSNVSKSTKLSPNVKYLGFKYLLPHEDHGFAQPPARALSQDLNMLEI